MTTAWKNGRFAPGTVKRVGRGLGSTPGRTSRGRTPVASRFPAITSPVAGGTPDLGRSAGGAAGVAPDRRVHRAARPAPRSRRGAGGARRPAGRVRCGCSSSWRPRPPGRAPCPKSRPRPSGPQPSSCEPPAAGEVVAPNQALHLAESHFPRVALTSISRGYPSFSSLGKECDRASALYASGTRMCHVVSIPFAIPC